MSQIKDTIESLIQTCAPAADVQITPGTTLADLQMDSLDIADLSLSIEAEFDADISQDDEGRYFHAGSTVGEIVTWAERRFSN